MIKRINRFQEIKERLRKEGKSYFLNRPEDIAAMEAMNEELEVMRREYLMKDHNSERAAANVVLNA